MSTHVGVPETESIIRGGTDLQNWPSGHSLAASGGASRCQTVTFGTDFFLSTSHTCKFPIIISHDEVYIQK